MIKKIGFDIVAMGERIRKLREERRITQSELGEKLSTPMTATAISLYEKGARQPGILVLNDLSKFFGVKLEYLVNGHSNESEPDIKIALRADKDLKHREEARRQILDFVDFVKNRVDKDGN